MDAGFKKIINLIKKTGDRLIVMDTDGQEPYAVMRLEDYEKLIEKNKSAVALEDLPLDSVSDFDDSAVAELPPEEDYKDDYDNRNKIIEKPMEEMAEDHYYFEPLEQ